MQQLGVQYHFLSKPIIEMAKTSMDPKRPSLCSFCSRMKRGLLYSWCVSVWVPGCVGVCVCVLCVCVYVCVPQTAFTLFSVFAHEARPLLLLVCEYVGVGMRGCPCEEEM